MSFEQFAPTPPERHPDSTQLGIDIASRIENARREARAISFEEYNDAMAQQNDAMREYIGGHIESDQLGERLHNLLPNSGFVDAASGNEFQAVLLGLGVPSDVIEEVVAHEQAHFEVNRRNGLNATFRVQLTTDREGREHWQPMVYVEVNSDMPNHREMAREAVAAPADLSDGDRRQLGR